MLRKLMLLAAMAAMMLTLFAPAAMAHTTWFAHDHDGDNDGVTVNLGDEEDVSDDIDVDARNSQLAVNDCQTTVDQNNTGDQRAFNYANGDDNRQGIAQSGVSADTHQGCGNALLVRH